MLHKTAADDAQSQSTKVFTNYKSASLVAPAFRQMYRVAGTSPSSHPEYANIVAMQPVHSSCLSSSQVHFLSGSQNFVVLTDAHYCLASDRSKPIMICRNSEPSAELVGWHASKPGAVVNLVSLHSGGMGQMAGLLHFNVIKCRPEEGGALDTVDVYVPIGSDKVRHFVMLNGCRECVLYMDKDGRSELWLVNLSRGNRARNPKHSSMHKNNLLKTEENSENQTEASAQQEYVFAQPFIIKSEITFAPQEQMLKLHNSEYGDVLILITTHDIYQIEFEPKQVLMKPLRILQKLQKLSSVGQKTSQLIRDGTYVSDGLGIMFATSSGLVALLETETITLVYDVREHIPAGKIEGQLQIKTIHALKGKFAVVGDRGEVFLFNMFGKDVVFHRKIAARLENHEMLNSVVQIADKQDELILTATVRKSSRRYLQVYCKSMLSPTAQFSKIYEAALFDSANASQCLKTAHSITNGITCIMKDNDLTFYRFHPDFSADDKPTEQLFSKHFFEKPINISFDPWGSNLIVQFKQFVKFFKFEYSDLVPFYTYNVRNVGYAGFTLAGDYILVAVDDLLYFVNPYSFVTERVIEAYGDIKSISLQDGLLCIAMKTKLGKNISDVLTLQIFKCSGQSFEKTLEVKVHPNQAYVAAHQFLIVGSSKQIMAYRHRQQSYGAISMSEQPMAVAYRRKIKLDNQFQHPTCIKIIQPLGIIVVGTNCGRVYQYLWPFHPEQPEQSYCVQCSVAEIEHVQLSPALDRLYIFPRNGSILQLDLVQYVEGEQLANMYVVQPKALYSGIPLKFQFASKEYLCPKYSAYVYENIRVADDAAQELRFILDKVKDDLEEGALRTTESLEGQLARLKQDSLGEMGALESQLQSTEASYKQKCEQVKSQIAEWAKKLEDESLKQKQEYEKKLLQLYREANRLKNIYYQIDKKQQEEKNNYRKQNQKVISLFIVEQEAIEQQLQQKYEQLSKSKQQFEIVQSEEASRRIDEELREFKQTMHKVIEDELKNEEDNKQYYLGSNGYFIKQINNLKVRRDQFQALINETYLQIKQLNEDQAEYTNKRKYLMEELQRKQKTIEQKERELIKLIESSEMMKKLKMTHEFELHEYEKQFEPIVTKMSNMEGNVQRMNADILREYLQKVEKDKSIIGSREKMDRLKKAKDRKIKAKLEISTRITRFLAQLETLLANPFQDGIQGKLMVLSEGEQYQVNQMLVSLKNQNTKLMRQKQFVRKQIVENQKREQNFSRNYNEINRHNAENTTLVREFNQLKKAKRDLEVKLHQVQLKLTAAKAIKLETPVKKSNSVVELKKKLSEKKLTPFQKHELEYNQMFNKGLTSETKMTRSGQSMSLLKTLIRDVEVTDSKYEKMQLVRDRIRSFINPQIRIRNLATQRVLFDKSRTDRQ